MAEAGDSSSHESLAASGDGASDCAGKSGLPNPLRLASSVGAFDATDGRALALFVPQVAPTGDGAEDELRAGFPRGWASRGDGDLAEQELITNTSLVRESSTVFSLGTSFSTRQ